MSPGAFYPNAWGVFGAQDELGTLNFLTPQRVLEAVKSVKTGQVFNLNLPLDAFDPPLISHRGLPQQEIFGLNQFHRDDKLNNLFMQASTQIDSLRHFGHPDQGFYNGVPGERLVVGTSDLGIQNVANRGVVGRGLLLDVAAYRDSVGQPINQNSNEQLTVADLEGTIALQNSPVQPGDILLLRTGWLGAIRNGSAVRQEVASSPGLAQDQALAAWLWDNQIALAAADNIALEAWPANRENLLTESERNGSFELSNHTGMLHRILIPLLGLSIGELWDLDELAKACSLKGSYTCLITAEPLNVLGGVGSPANALAIL